MFTMRSTARSCPTILPKSRRSKSSTSGLRISGSRSTSSETNGLTIALHLLPVFSQTSQDSREPASTLNPAVRLPIEFSGHVSFGRRFPLFGGIAVHLRPYRHRELRALAVGLCFFDGLAV